MRIHILSVNHGVAKTWLQGRTLHWRVLHILLPLCSLFLHNYVPETDLSQGYDPGSPHLTWDHPFYDIARHQIIEVAG